MKIKENYNSHFRMKEEDIVLYAKEKLDFFDKSANLKASEIGDGNINYVFKVWDEKTKKSVVIKQADKLLRSSGRPLDIDRIRIEAEALKLHNSLAPGLTPRVYKYDPIMCAIAMEDISCHSNLRKALLKRKTFPKFADHISSYIVYALLPTTDLIMDSEIKKDKVKEFTNKDLCQISEDLVFTEPFTDYKGRNIVLKDNIAFVEKELYNDEALKLEAAKLKNKFLTNTQALIHGDLHSGSIFVTKASTKVLDHEFAFYGPIGYDLGNVIGNLFLALGNAYIIGGKGEFTNWIENTIDEIINLFKVKFFKLYIEQVKEAMLKQESFMNWYLGSILADTAGMAGLEIIRRIVGDAKAQDITDIEDNESRIKIERILIKTAKRFILKREELKNGKDYCREFHYYYNIKTY